MRYFFTPEKDLPAGVGFVPLGRAHLLMLAGLALLTSALVVLGCRMEREKRLHMLRGIAVFMVVMELLKDFLLAVQGAFSVGYLPLHLCSMDMFICLYWAWHPEREGGGQCLYSLGLSGGVAALLFPDWWDMPLWHFQSLHSFLYHALLVAVPMIALITGMVRPRVRQIWRPMLFLVAVAVPVYGLNRLLGTNFMFLQYPVPGTPLEWCGRFPGGYLLGYGLLVMGVLILLNLPFDLWGWGKQRREKRRKSC